MRKPSNIVRKPNNKNVEGMLKTDIKILQKKITIAKKQLKCNHDWKFIKNYYAEDSHWECEKCKTVTGANGWRWY